MSIRSCSRSDFHSHTSAYALIYYRASRSFVFASYIKKLDMVPELLEDMCNVSLSSGEKLIAQFCFKFIPVKIVGRELLVDLLVLEMVDDDGIQGMN